MVVEHLTFRIPLALQAKFLACDAEIWTATLARQDGFVSKDYWADASDPDMLHLLIRWTSHDHWHAVPKTLLDETGRRFTAAVGQAWPTLSCTAYDVLSG